MGSVLAATAVISCVSTCLAHAQRAWTDVDAVCCALSGVDTHHDVSEWTAHLTAAFQSAYEADAVQTRSATKQHKPRRPRIFVCNDAIAALASASAALNGIALVAGTGCIAVGCSNGSSEVRVGGWGPLFGDRGGGMDIGLQALSTIRLCVERNPQDASCEGLLDSVLLSAGVADVTELVRWVYADASWARVAALAPAVIRSAEAGVLKARSILDTAARAAANAAMTAYERVSASGSFKAGQLVLVGGLLREPQAAFGKQMQDALLRTGLLGHFDARDVHWCVRSKHCIVVYCPCQHWCSGLPCIKASCAALSAAGLALCFEFPRSCVSTPTGIAPFATHTHLQGRRRTSAWRSAARAART